MSFKKKEVLIVIQLHTTYNWLYKPRYKYKNIYRNVFVDRHKQSDVNEDQKNILYKIEKLKFYIIDFNKNDIMKLKVYLVDYVVKENNWQ